MELPLATQEEVENEVGNLEGLWPLPSKIWLLKGVNRFASLSGPCDCHVNQTKPDEETRVCPMRVLGSGLSAIAGFSDREYAVRLAGERFKAKVSTLSQALKIAKRQGEDGVVVVIQTNAGVDTRFFPCE